MPIVTTNSSPAGRIRRVRAAAVSSGDTGAGPNEPVGFAALYPANPFDTMPPTSDAGDAYKFTRYEIVAGNRLEIRTDGDGGASDPNYMRHNYLAGDAGGQVNSTYRAGGDFSGASLESPKTQFYTRIRVRLSPSWSDNGNAGTKFFFFSSFTENTQNNNHYVSMTDVGELRFGVGTQYNDNLLLNRYFDGPSALAKGAWHDLEILAIANTTVPGVSETADGVLRVWANNTLRREVTDVLWFRRHQTACWRSFYANPTFGGGSNPVPADQYYDVDHWYTSLKA